MAPESSLSPRAPVTARSSREWTFSEEPSHPLVHQLDPLTWHARSTVQAGQGQLFAAAGRAVQHPAWRFDTQPSEGRRGHSTASVSASTSHHRHRMPRYPRYGASRRWPERDSGRMTSTRGSAIALYRWSSHRLDAARSCPREVKPGLATKKPSVRGDSSLRSPEPICAPAVMQGGRVGQRGAKLPDRTARGNAAGIELTARAEVANATGEATAVRSSDRISRLSVAMAGARGIAITPPSPPALP